ncbi:MAG: hypothetical protein JXA54_07315 [Candidatus Heimdallarchaeota archaeon]|nr:hypothetical protein [Candidatus Heimdallarchaeota archaeon]
MKKISKRKGFQIDKAFFKDNEQLFMKVFDYVIWSIIEPLITEVDQTKYHEIKQTIRDLFFETLTSNGKAKNKLPRKISIGTDALISEFITQLINDFSTSFYEDLMEYEKLNDILVSLNDLTSQQILISWIDQLVENSIAPLLIFSVKTPKKIDIIKQIITRVLIAIAQGEIKTIEAENKIVNDLSNNYNLTNELVLFIKSIVKTFAQFNGKYGLRELAKIGEESIKSADSHLKKTTSNVTKSLNETIYEKERIITEWSKNVLLPASIGLRIAEKKSYNEFIENSRKNFELFLDQALTANDFEKRVNDDLKKFGGDDEELILSIVESIVSSVKFLELARIDDPSLSLLVVLGDEEIENAKRGFT